MYETRLFLSASDILEDQHLALTKKKFPFHSAPWLMHLVNIEGDSGNHRQGREAAVEKARGKKKKGEQVQTIHTSPSMCCRGYHAEARTDASAQLEPKNDNLDPMEEAITHSIVPQERVALLASLKKFSIFTAWIMYIRATSYF